MRKAHQFASGRGLAVLHAVQSLFAQQVTCQHVLSEPVENIQLEIHSYLQNLIRHKEKISIRYK